jgi:hypothetical protein
MPEHQAYRLTDDFADAESITVAGPDGRTIRLHELLAEDTQSNPAGTIVTSDEYVKHTLDTHIAFQRTTVEGWQPAEGDDGQPLEPAELADLSKADLVERAERVGVDSSGTKAAILHRLAPDHFADPSGPDVGPTDLNPDGSPVVESEEG